MRDKIILMQCYCISSLRTLFMEVDTHTMPRCTIIVQTVQYRSIKLMVTTMLIVNNNMNSAV